MSASRSADSAWPESLQTVVANWSLMLTVHAANFVFYDVVLAFSAVLVYLDLRHDHNMRCSFLHLVCIVVVFVRLHFLVSFVLDVVVFSPTHSEPFQSSRSLVALKSSEECSVNTFYSIISDSNKAFSSLTFGDIWLSQVLGIPDLQPDYNSSYWPVLAWLFTAPLTEQHK